MARSLLVCAAAYVAALVAAIAVGGVSTGAHPLLVALMADVVATVVVFAFSAALDNSSIYDPYWSLAPLPIALYFALPAHFWMHARRRAEDTEP